MNNDEVYELVLHIARLGRDNPQRPQLHRVAPFKFYFQDDVLRREILDERDGGCTPREIVVRFLLLMAVLDQGPDIPGVRKMLIEVTNNLYSREIRLLHRPADFFREVGIAIDQIIKSHESVKAIRAEVWAQENRSRASRYNLFKYDRNQTKALDYAVSRWGVPLLLPVFLEKDPDFHLSEKFSQKDNPTLLLDYLEMWPSAEKMSNQIKAHSRYGLGKAIGDKATHLFAKWIVDTFRLSRRTENDDVGWSSFSYEVPYDSNAGRVLWRTGYVLHWLDEEVLLRKKVIQPSAGKGGTHYLRVTNLRGLKVPLDHPHLSLQQRELYIMLTQQYFREGRPRKAQFQRLQHLVLLDYSQSQPEDMLTVANFDDGLIYIGTQFCYNHGKPKCKECLLQNLCEGYQGYPDRIRKYRT